MRAMARLAKQHPTSFRELLEQERALLGLPPLSEVRPGPKPKENHGNSTQR